MSSIKRMSLEKMERLQNKAIEIGKMLDGMEMNDAFYVIGYVHECMIVMLEKMGAGHEITAPKKE
jgi:hypothetical protein